MARYSFWFSSGEMCKFSRTLYNRQLIQFARIPVEFVVRFIRCQNRVKVITSRKSVSLLARTMVKPVNFKITL